jgi:hypothetical protein
MPDLILSSFNATIDQWMQVLDSYTLEQLCLQPQPGRWSLGQMYRHIIDDTTWFVEQMQASLTTNENSDQQMHKNARAMLAANAFPDIMIEGPATNTFIPQPQSKEELLQGLQSIKTAVNRLDFTAPSGKTRHPGLLYFNAKEWLQFADMHMRHHFRQKQRIDHYLFK